MKKVGTISSALGFIFLGVWMMMQKIDSNIAEEIFKWWPTIFIIIGLEIIYYFGKNKNNQKVGFNFLFIFIVIIFLGINTYQGVTNKFHMGWEYFNKNGIVSKNNMFDEFGNKSKKVEFNKSFLPQSKNIELNTDNADIEIKKSKDDKVTIESSVYVDKDSNNYNLKIDGDKIDLKNSNIKGIKGTIYIPDGLTIKAESDNFKLDCDDLNLKTNFNIKCDNGMVNIKANCEDINIEMDNGTVNLSNELTKNVNVTMDNGTVKFNTKEKNLNVNLSLDAGVCSFNGESRVNSGIKRNIGEGTGIVKVKLDHGTINVKSQE